MPTLKFRLLPFFWLFAFLTLLCAHGASAQDHFVFSNVPANVVAGQSFQVSVTAETSSNMTDTSYGGIVTLTSTDDIGTPGPNTSGNNPSETSTASGGVAMLVVTLRTATGGSSNTTLTATGSGVTGATSNGIYVSAASPIKLKFATTSAPTTSDVPSSATVGSAFNVTVTAEDQYNNPVTGDTDTVSLTSSDPAGTLNGSSSALLSTSPTVTLSGGTKSFSVTLNTDNASPGQTLTAADTTNPTLANATAAISVSGSAAASQLVFTSPPTSVTDGQAFSVTVTAEDHFGNTVTSEMDSVALGGGGAGASLPTAAPLSGGTVTFSNDVTLNTVGSQTLTAADQAPSTTVQSASANITVTPTHLAFTSVPAMAQVGQALSSVTVTLEDENGNAVTSGTDANDSVTLSGGGANATLPPAANLVNGAFTFTNSVTLNTDGSPTLTATDTTNSAVQPGTSAAITVSGSTGTATHLAFTSVPSSTTVGTPFSVTVTAEDRFNNPVTSDTDMVSLTSTDPAGTLNGSSSALLSTFPTITLSGGTATASITLNTDNINPGQMLTAADTSHTAVASVTSGNITVTGSTGTATHLVLTTDLPTPGTPPTPTATVGTAFSVTVTAEDQYGNTVTGDTDSVALSGGGAGAVLPAAANLVSGTQTFSVTLNTDGSQTLTATDTTNPTAVNHATAAIAVTGNTGTATHLAFTSVPASATVGNAFSVTVAAEDQFNNVVTTNTDSVALGGGGAGASLPAAHQLTNGAYTFTNSVTLNTDNTNPGQALTATDDAPATTVAGATADITVTGSLSAVSTLAFTALPPPANAPAATVGVSFPVTVAAEDQYSNIIVNNTDSVLFSSHDPLAAFSTNPVTLSSGTATINVTLNTDGSQTLAAADQTTTSANQAIAHIQVNGVGALSKLVVTPTATSATAGIPLTISIKGEDAAGNTVAIPSGDAITLTSVDPKGTVGTATISSSGMASGSYTFGTATATGWQVTATDATSHVNGISSAITVSAGTATQIVFVQPTNNSATAGTAFTLEVAAEDQYGNINLNNSDSVTISSSDGLASGIGPVTLSHGTQTEQFTLNTTGSQTITAADSSISGPGGAAIITLAVSGGAKQLKVAPATSTPTAGTPFSVTVSGEDAQGNRIDLTNGDSITLTDTVNGTTTTLSTATASGGQAIFSSTNAITLTVAGSQTLTATDTTDGNIKGTATVNVMSGATSKLVFTSVPPSATINTAFSVTVTAEDANGNTVTTDGDTVTLSGGGASASKALSGGVATVSNVTLNQPGYPTLTAADTTTTGIMPATAIVTVAPTITSVSAAGASVTPLVLPGTVLNTTPPTNAGALKLEPGSDQTLTVTGAGFVADSVASLNGVPLGTTVKPNSTTQLTVDVPAADVSASTSAASAGLAQLTISIPLSGSATPTVTSATANVPVNPVMALPMFPYPGADAYGLRMFSVPYGYTADPFQVLALTTLTPTASPVSPETSVSSYDPLMDVLTGAETVTGALYNWNPKTSVYLSDTVGATNPPLQPGQGYWIISDSPSTPLGVMQVGATVSSNPYTISLTAGWNMIGDPFTVAVPLAGLQVISQQGEVLNVYNTNSSGYSAGPAVSDGIINPVLYSWNGTDYQAHYYGNSDSSVPSPDVLLPYEGYWVYAYQDCQLQVTHN